METVRRPVRDATGRAEGFTLIELLIVVAIVAILAAIAVPNFLEAQVRSKVSRVKADMRSLGTAIQAYAVDHNAYPPNNGLDPADPMGMTFPTKRMLVPLSTPIAYIANSHLPDVFAKAGPAGRPILVYVRLSLEEGLLKVLYPAAGIPPDTTARVAENCFYLQSVGPDGASILTQFLGQGMTLQQATFASIAGFVGGDFVYDPTNGTTSVGDISYSGKGFIEKAF